MTNNNSRRRFLGAMLVVVAAAFTALGGGMNGMLLKWGMSPVTIIGFDTLFAGVAGIVFYSIMNRTSGSKWRDFASWRIIGTVLAMTACTAGFKLGFIFAQMVIPVAEVSCVYYAAQSLPALWDGFKTVKETKGGISPKVVSAAKAFFAPMMALSGIVLFTEPWSANLGGTLPGVLLAFGAGLTRVVFFWFTRRMHEGNASQESEAAKKRQAANDSMLAPLSYLLTGVVTLGAIGWHPVDFRPVGSMLVLAMLLGVGLLSTAAPNELQMRGQRFLTSAEFSVTRSLSPMFAALVGVVVLSQALDVIQWAAVAISVGSLLAKNLKGIKKSRPGAPGAPVKTREPVR